MKVQSKEDPSVTFEVNETFYKNHKDQLQPAKAAPKKETKAAKPAKKAPVKKG